jgi:peptidoglycan/xylan/chitin deacetylase (PgdA/CDA1 family)
MKKITLLLLLAAFAAHAQQINWPHHKKAAIVLTYDDGLTSQLQNAVPQLEAGHLTATFFLIGDMDTKNIPLWRALSKKGFELGNHTLYHPCISTPDNPVPSDNYTVAGILNEIGVMNNFLFAVDGKTSRTYAYPCTETTVGGKDYVDSLRKYNLVKYARVGGDVDAVITDFKHLDPLQIPSYGLDDNTPADKLIAFVKRVQQSGGMGIFMFHGIGGDYITTSAEAHQQLLDYLKKNRKTIWVAPFQQAMDYALKAAK